MAFLKVTRRTLISGNLPIILGIILGLFLHTNITYFFDCNKEIEDSITPRFERADVFQRPLAPRLLKPEEKLSLNGSRRASSKVVRPRYYSTELGIREKLFVGILTSEEKISEQAVHINKTLTHLVDKVKFFITAQRKFKSNFNLSGVVGFTDTRFRYRPFQVLKYISDTFMQDFDYYYLMNDFNYLNAALLNDIVHKISVKSQVYMGTTVNDGSYCDINAGILISNSVLKAMKEHLDWCVINTISDDHSENIGRCIHHSVGLACQNTVQGQYFSSFKVKHFSIESHFNELIQHKDFNSAVTVYPVTEPIDFHILHAYYSKMRLLDFNKKIDVLSKKLDESWPPGIRPGATPASRFDVPNTFFFNMTHMYFPDDYTNIQKHTTVDLEDIQHIIRKIVTTTIHYENLTYLRLINGYRTFDLSRGLDYVLDLCFHDKRSGQEIIKRFEVCKALSSVEFIPVPYVTENSRVIILLPIQESEVTTAMSFLEKYEQNIMTRKEKAFLMLVFLYQYNTDSKTNTVDPFGNIKSFALKTSEKYNNEDTKIAWVSIRLPNANQTITIEEFPAINFAIIDLSLRKIGLENIVFFANVYADFTMDFLNRVKMNTIENFQVFSIIPFRQYNPKISQIEQLDITKNSGKFDRDEYRFISFYGKDYVNARKASKHFLPIVRVDTDIDYLLYHPNKHDGNVFKMFLQNTEDLHCMRATDMSLKVIYHEVYGTRSRFYGTKSQIASFLVQHTDILSD